MRASSGNGGEYFADNVHELMGWILGRNGLHCETETCNIAVNATDNDGILQVEVWVYASRDDALNDWHGNLVLGVIHGYSGGLEIHYGLDD